MNKETLKNEHYEKVKQYLQNMKPFKEDSYVSVPIMNTPEDYQEFVVKNFIRCGAIPKSKLVKGKKYKGSCRNAGEAIWMGDHFIYRRHKFGSEFDEKINHFEDDNGYDLFVPIFEVEE